MGAYVYGRMKITKAGFKTFPVANGGTIDIGNIKYLYKPLDRFSFSDWIVKMAVRQEALSNRIEKSWEGMELPRYAFLGKKIGKSDEGDKIYEEEKVFDTTTRKNMKGSNIGKFPAVGYDDPYGFGDCVGVLKKVGNRWTFFPNEKF